jgi:hypothetical protein
MKLLVALAFVLSASAFAQDSSSGCGLGWQVSQKNSLLSSAIRSTTNTVLPNTFSMTFGSSGCSQHSIVKNESEQQYFVEANLERLSLEMAVGEGEYLRSFAAVMGCGASVGEFSTAVQKSYSEIFGDSATPSRVLEGVRREIRSNPSLVRACGATT